MMKVRLPELRIERNMSVSQLAELSGVSRLTIKKTETSGGCMVAPALKLAAALGVTLAQLCGNETSEPGFNSEE